MNINEYEKKVYSQNGEDGIIEELFNQVGTTNKFFVEFGVQNGLECNTAHLSFNKHWDGLLIEGSESVFGYLVKNYHHLQNIKTVNHFVTADNIISIFKQNQVPVEFDLLSIDIDGNDYWIWEVLCSRYFKPRIVVIEYNASYPPPAKWVMQYNPTHEWNGTNYYGASITSLYNLGLELEYSLIGTDRRGVNAFFVRKDLMELVKFEEKAPKHAYNTPKYGPHNGGHPPGQGAYLEI